MKIAKAFLLYYSFCLSIFITLGTAILGWQSGNLLFFVLFLPVVAYFGLTIFKIKRWRKLFLYYNFILTTIMAIMGFVGTSSIPQLISAILFLPMAFYFWLLVLPKRNKKLPIPDKMLPAISPINTTAEKITKGKVKKLEGEVLPNTKFGKSFDLDRRMFLKLIGSTGVMLFLFSIFTKKAEGAFFGSVPGPGTVALKDTAGVQIDPAIKSPTDGYKISQIDDSSPAYYGFIERTGKWFIMKEDSTTGAYRYAKGASSFATNWTNRAALTYDYFNTVFP